MGKCVRKSLLPKIAKHWHGLHLASREITLIPSMVIVGGDEEIIRKERIE